MTETSVVNPRSVRDIIERRKIVMEQLAEVLVVSLHLEREPEDIDPDSPLFGTGLGLDSIDAVELVVAIEAAFDVRFPEAAELQPLRTFNTLVDFILRGQDS